MIFDSVEGFDHFMWRVSLFSRLNLVVAASITEKHSDVHFS